VEREDNQALMTEVGKDELLETLQSFQKDKIPRPNGLPIEFFHSCYDFIENDLGRLVEASRTSRKTLATFNNTFIALIPKTYNPTCYEIFQSISHCNNIYKIISKIISRRLKETLS
jgi:hypothetical protein